MLTGLRCGGTPVMSWPSMITRPASVFNSVQWLNTAPLMDSTSSPAGSKKLRRKMPARVMSTVAFAASTIRSSPSESVSWVRDMCGYFTEVEAETIRVLGKEKANYFVEVDNDGMEILRAINVAYPGEEGIVAEARVVCGERLVATATASFIIQAVGGDSADAH